VALPRENRLKLKSDFEKLKSGKVLKSGPFLLRCRPNDRAKLFAVNTPRRIGNAVLRNRIKRVIVEWLRLNLAEIPPGYFLISVQAHPPKGWEASLNLTLGALIRKAANEIGRTD
jgi:ribonuclease P protein component